MKLKKRWTMASDFMLDILFGAASLAVVYAVAVGLELAVYYLSVLGISRYTILVLTGTHYLIETLDVVVFCAYSLYVSAEMIKIGVRVCAEIIQTVITALKELF